MSVWFVIPSKRPEVEARQCLEAWADMGYRIAIAREAGDGCISADWGWVVVTRYLGWARSVNLLAQTVMAGNDDAEWFVTGGDDYWPDPNRRADEIAAECREYFAGRYGAERVDNKTVAISPEAFERTRTFGVMQPTGDRWSEGRCTTCSGTGQVDLYTLALTPGALKHLKIACLDCNGRGISAVIDRIAGSPWMGREFCRRMYHGAGPMYNGYYHNFADEELQCVARRLGVFWQRRDITQEHRHWATARPKSPTHTGLAGDVRNMPAWAQKINDPKQSDWDRSKALFAKRKASGFPGHEPLEV